MYTTTGSVRGGCGHVHKRLETACKCILADHSSVKRFRGYSDRRVTRVDGMDLSQHELHEISFLLNES